jgi:hypothetical protein
MSFSSLADLSYLTWCEQLAGTGDTRIAAMIIPKLLLELVQ